MEPTTNNASGKIIGALIIGLLVGFLAGVFWQERRSSTVPVENNSSTALQTTTKDKTTSSETGAAVTGKAAETASGSLTVENQVASDRVEIANIDAKEILWVAVREEVDGKIGNILGAQKVFVGDGQKIVVELLRPTIAGGTYRVVLYKDIGTPAFNYREDTPIEGVEGKFVAK